MSLACSSDDEKMKFATFAISSDNPDYIEIYAIDSVIDSEGKIAKISAIELYVKDVFHLKLNAESAEYNYKGYFVTTGVLKKNMINEAIVIVKYKYGDLTFCGPMMDYKLTDLFNVIKPAKIKHPKPPKPVVPFDG